MARRSKLSPDLIDAIVEGVSLGVPIRFIAQKLRVSPDTVSDWLVRGRTSVESHWDNLERKNREELEDLARRAQFLKVAVAGWSDDEIRLALMIREAPYRELAARVEAGEGDAHQYAIEQIRRAMPTTWQAAAWYLERRYPELYAPRYRTELTGKDGGPVQTEEVGSAKEELLGALREAKDRRASLRAVPDPEENPETGTGAG